MPRHAYLARFFLGWNLEHELDDSKEEVERVESDKHAKKLRLTPW